jgi:hypothetical protein
MGNTYTCSICGKVGKSFASMANEICPKNLPKGQNTHAIPVFGDM